MGKSYKNNQRVAFIAFYNGVGSFHIRLPIVYKASYLGLLYPLFPIVLLSSMFVGGVFVSRTSVSDARYLSSIHVEHHWLHRWCKESSVILCGGID